LLITGKLAVFYFQNKGGIVDDQKKSTSDTGNYQQAYRLSAEMMLEDKINRLETRLRQLKELRKHVAWQGLSHDADEALWQLFAEMR
jgi:hypothetical protein